MLDSLLQIFFPESCRGCGASGRAICSRCIKSIPRATNLPKYTFAVFDYGHRLVRWTIRDLKYNRKSESARALGNAAIPFLKEYLEAHHDYVLIPIPGHIQKKHARGFNQSELLASWWSKELPQSRVEKFLTKVVFTLPQAHLKRHERLSNVVHTMKCTRTLDPNKTYIIVDDVITTGATFAEARRALAAAGAHTIYGIALAHGFAHK